MKILWFIENLCLGGQQTYSINLIREINKNKNVKTDVIYLNDGELKDKFKNVSSKLIHLNNFKKKEYYNPFKTIKLIYSYYYFLKKNKYDVVVSNGIISFGVTSIIKFFFYFKHARLLGGPILDTEPTYEKYFHNILPFHKNLDYAFGWEGTNYLESKRYGNKLITFNPSVDTNMFYPNESKVRTHIRNKYLIKDEDIVIGWVGRISFNMQIKNTILLGGELQKRGLRNFKILIVGGGDWESEMFELISENGIKENCIHLGWQPMEYIPDLYQAMDIVPLLERNPCGGSIVREAMACGSLVISVNGKNKSQSSWIFNRDNGILVSDDNYVSECADVIEEYSKDKTDKFKSICKRGVNYAKDKMSFKQSSATIMKNILND